MPPGSHTFQQAENRVWDREGRGGPRLGNTDEAGGEAQGPGRDREQVNGLKGSEHGAEHFPCMLSFNSQYNSFLHRKVEAWKATCATSPGYRGVALGLKAYLTSESKPRISTIKGEELKSGGWRDLAVGGQCRLAI